jgi:pimeloyl-ACP methyl ester carboxylesterase
MLLRLYSRLIAFLLRRMGARRLRFDEGETSLAYYRLGPRDAEPWLLVHGLGSIAATWAPVIRALRGSCRLLIPEMSALGGSRIPGGGCGVERAAQLLARLLEHELGGAPATVCGISLGAWAAVRLTLERPELVSRLLLIDAGGYRHQDWDKIRTLVTVDDLAGVDRLYKALFVRVPWALRISRKDFLASYSSPAVRNTIQDLKEEDTFDDDDLARLRVPTGLIWGEKDGLFSLEVARAMAAALPQARLEILPGCGHAVHMECPQRLVTAIERFRRATSSRTSPALPRTA